MNRCVLVISIASCLFAGNFMTNGDFELPLSNGWQQSSSGSSIIIDRATTYDPDPDYEAQAYKGAGSGYARLLQVVDIPVTDVDFSAKLKVYAYDNNADTLCWAAAALFVEYYNASGSILGTTRICMRTTPCPWINSSTCHLIVVPDSLWHNYSFNIEDELANLSGINPANVAKIGIALYDTTAHTC